MAFNGHLPFRAANDAESILAGCIKHLYPVRQVHSSVNAFVLDVPLKHIKVVAKIKTVHNRPRAVDLS